MKKTRRTAQVGQTIRDALVEVIRYDIKDAALAMASITDVEVSPDLHYARVFVSGLDEQQTRDAVARLQDLRGRVRGFLGKRIRLRFTPELEFRYDDTTMRAGRIEDLLKDLKPTDDNSSDDANDE
ncbi:MAG: 30S ribosome-binding factor RbfA [Acidobacteria bacterium]|nr:30S ribosome-binding factor RbfA [Acidobacteriota bacterium]